MPCRLHGMGRPGSSSGEQRHHRLILQQPLPCLIQPTLVLESGESKKFGRGWGGRVDPAKRRQAKKWSENTGTSFVLGVSRFIVELFRQGQGTKDKIVMGTPAPETLVHSHSWPSTSLSHFQAPFCR